MTEILKQAALSEKRNLEALERGGEAWDSSKNLKENGQDTQREHDPRTLFPCFCVCLSLTSLHSGLTLSAFSYGSSGVALIQQLDKKGEGFPTSFIWKNPWLFCSLVGLF